jgi:ribosomal-protein-alanine N-acetyltransferase
VHGAHCDPTPALADNPLVAGPGTRRTRAPLRIETERLILRLPELNDAGEIAAYYRENQHHLQPWSPRWPPDVRTEEFWREQVPQRHADVTDGTAVALFLFEKRAPRRIAGNLSLTQIVRGAAQRCTIGYGLAARAQGQGLMVEAVRAAVAYAFDDLRLHRVTASYLPRNRRSADVLRRAGFQIEGYAKDYLRIDGRWEDHIIAAITNPAWQGRG